MNTSNPLAGNYSEVRLYTNTPLSLSPLLRFLGSVRVKERLEEISIVTKEKVVEDKEIEDDEGHPNYRNALKRLECR